MADLLARYAAAIKSLGPDTIGRLEDTVKNFTMLFHGRYGVYELRNESILTFVNVLSMYHDSILSRAPRFPVELVYGSGNKMARLAQFLYPLLKSTENLAEMLGFRYLTPQQKWGVILTIEILKAFCRIIVLYSNGGRMLIQPSAFECESQLAVQRINNKDQFADIKKMYRSHGRGIGDNTHGQFARTEIFSRPTKLRILADLLHSLRPVFYVMGRLLFPPGSWNPFFVSAALDGLSRMLYSRDLRNMTEREQQELTRRVFQWLFYLFRPPFFERFSMIPLSAIVRALGKIPLIGALFANLLDLLLAFQTHYFYSAAS